MRNWLYFLIKFGFKRSRLLPLLLILCVHVFAQNGAEIQEPSQSVLRLDSLAKSYERTSIDSSVYYYRLAITKARRSNDFAYVATTMNHLGFNSIYLLKNETKALEWINQAISVAKKNDDLLNLAEGHKLLAVIATDQQIGNPVELTEIAVNYAQQIDAWQIEIDCYEILSGYLVRNQRYEEAETIFKKLSIISKKHDLDSWFSSSFSYAEFLDNQGREAEANTIYQELNGVKSSLKRSKGYFVYMNDTGKLATKLKNYDEAEQIFLDVLDYEKSQARVDTFHLSFIYNSLMTLYSDKGDYKKAYETSSKWLETILWLNQKKQTRDSQVKMTQLKSSLDLEKKEVEINLLETQKEEQLLLLIGAIFLLAILAASVFYVQKGKREIERQRTELSKLNATKDKLFTILSHDLRSPVANLENNVMLSNWGALNQAEFAESVQGLGIEVSRVRNMLEDMLYWATSQMGGIKSNPTQVEIQPVVAEQTNILKNKASEKGIQLTNDIPSRLSIYADKNHVAIIFRNLLQNALKFTPQNGEIRITYREGATKQIDIRDNGIGMSEDQLRNLFKIGEHNSRAGTNLETGMGIGLILVKELIELNNLRLSVKSKVDEGTTFSISF